jgi:hypothetical protein
LILSGQFWLNLGLPSSKSSIKVLNNGPKLRLF